MNMWWNLIDEWWINIFKEGIRLEIFKFDFKKEIKKLVWKFWKFFQKSPLCWNEE